MKFDPKDLVLGALVIVVLFFLWHRAASGYNEVDFPSTMGEMEAEALFTRTSTEYADELNKKMEDAQKKNDMAALQKIGAEGHQALVKLQKAYYDYLRSKGKEVKED
jgi:hypothetical protein